MARITVEDCLKRVDNRFALIHLAAKRVRQIRKGADALVVCKNKDVVTSLREIAQGKVFAMPSDSAPPALETFQEPEIPELDLLGAEELETELLPDPELLVAEDPEAEPEG